jgi:hypothetical protein
LSECLLSLLSSSFGLLFSKGEENLTTHKIKLFSGANINEKGQKEISQGKKEKSERVEPNMFYLARSELGPLAAVCETRA